jgi:prepilin-type N-terminal cleavage/methylation domain-containing protein
MSGNRQAVFGVVGASLLANFRKTSNVEDSMDKEKGFTLLELLVAMLLLALVSTMIGSVLHVGINFADKGEKRLLAMEREHGFLDLLRGQIRAACFDERQRKMLISADEESLRLVTRAPLLYRGTGPVLAIYRYHQGEERLYYLEKRDYYNLDYGVDYVPDFNEMIVLTTTAEPPVLAHDPESGAVAVRFAGADYQFFPKAGFAVRF